MRIFRKKSLKNMFSVVTPTHMRNRIYIIKPASNTAVNTDTMNTGNQDGLSLKRRKMTRRNALGILPFFPKRYHL